MNKMSFLSFLPQYFVWHYGTALADFLRVVSNFYWCIWNYFSIELLARSFFVPWKRLNEAHSGFLARAIVVLIMRIIGILARLSVFAAAAISFILLAVASVIAFFIWIVFPLAVVLLAIAGIRSFLL